MGLGKRLIQARESRGYKQNQLAELLCISATRLNYWEKDKREPDTESINKLAKALGVTDNFLLGFGVFENWDSIYEKKETIINTINTIFPQLKQFNLKDDCLFISILDALVKEIKIIDDDVTIYPKAFSMENFSEFSISNQTELSLVEKTLLKKYRILDEYGKKAVDSVLNVEYERCIQTQHNNSKNFIEKHCEI